MPGMEDELLTAKAESWRRFLCGEGEMPEWDEAFRSSCFITPGKSVFLLIRTPTGVKLLGTARFAKDLPGNLPGERWRLAKSGAAVLTELNGESAGALRSFLQLPAPGCLKDGGCEAVLLCRSGIADGTGDVLPTLEQEDLTPCWIGGSADEAFWSAFAAGWRNPFFRCRSLLKLGTGGAENPDLNGKYAGRTFVLNDGCVLESLTGVKFGLPEELPGCEAVETGSAAELLVLLREAVKAGGQPGLAVVRCDDPAEEMRCRSVALCYGSGHVAVAPARWYELRQNGDRNTGCDFRNYPLAEAAEQIKNMVNKTIK